MSATLKRVEALANLVDRAIDDLAKSDVSARNETSETLSNVYNVFANEREYLNVELADELFDGEEDLNG